MMFEKRKGISTFIATLLLMVLAVSAGVVIYAYTMGYLGGFGVPQTMGAISIDTYRMNTDATMDVWKDPNPQSNPATYGPAVLVYIRNIGKVSFVCDSVYLDGVLLTKTTDWTLQDETGLTAIPGPITADTVAEGKIGTLRLVQKQGRFVASKTYEIKIIGKDNTQLSFQVKK